ncbi:ATP-binding protein [Lichenihabitans sp. Uapishka_5]|uniref:ATP-binding protein n=1 Tax=Lichenihabitans sp. Uapishka_5 TaxID=3037302 RepID=UPI0029E8282D|nr:ATP-binding protein [Lichenihabitans sp. Uapishka_5]MDX7952420.1 ATP-binding protein [Lichenihabitans sp. Uapishka_5]
MGPMAGWPETALASFTVDTKLFQELGELLVAKEATALVELIKNAYDADATVVTVMATELSRIETGQILVSDDGAGMTETEFDRGFLRIAGRSKVTADRRSPVFGRRYTGEKGVGRLAAHKLATKVSIRSRKAGAAPRGAVALPPAVSGIKAEIDWNAIERLETLDQVSGSDAVTLTRTVPKDGRVLASGTTLTLTPLRKAWSTRMVDSFMKEALTLAPSAVLWDVLPEGVTRDPLLFERVPVRDQSTTDPGFRIEFAGELAVQDVVSPDVAQAASWIAEIHHDRGSGTLRIAVAPTAAELRENPSAESFTLTKQLGAEKGPSFRARILQRSKKAWDPAVQGIRVFMEGFRVPPYGDQTDDWLGVDRSYRSRAHRVLSSLSALAEDEVPPGLATEELSIQGSSAYMGAVYLHRSTSPELEMLVNREGFLPGPGLDFITDWVRVASDLIVRLGYAARHEIKEVKREERERQKQLAKRADLGEAPAALRVRESAVAASHQMDIVRSSLLEGDLDAAVAAANAAKPHIDDVRVLSDEFGGEAVMWRVLASLGTELAAFVHEVNALGMEAAGIVSSLDAALPAIGNGPARTSVQTARRAALALADRIRRNATYLVDATSFKGRRRRSRLPLRDRLEGVLPFFETRIRAAGITFVNEVPVDLRTPPMFPSELAGIFTNLVSNAVKFAGDRGRISASAELADGSLRITMQNTGEPVDLRSAKKLFEAFQSSTERPDAVLGQGMGMGLTITRAFVQEYGGTIEFVRPMEGFSTAIRLEIPGR